MAEGSMLEKESGVLKSFLWCHDMAMTPADGKLNGGVGIFEALMAGRHSCFLTPL